MIAKLKQLSRIIPTLVVFFAILTIQTVVFANPVQAVEAPEAVIDRDAKSWLTYRAIWEDCIHEGKNVTRDDLTSGLWFNGNNKADFGYYTYDLGDEGDDKTIDISCADGSAMDRFADQIMGFSDEIEMYCILDDKLDDRGGDAKDTIEPEAGDGECENSQSWTVVWNRTSDGNWRGAFTDTLDEAPHYRMNLNLDDNQRNEGNWLIPGRYALKYWIGKESLEVMCGGSVALSNGLTDLSTDNANVVSVDIVDYATGKLTESANYELTGGRLDDGDEGNTEFKARFFNNKHEPKTCNGMAEDTRQYSEHFVWYITHYWAQSVADHFKAEFTVTSAMKRSICGPAPGRNQPQTAYSRCVLSITSTFNDMLDVCKNTDPVLQPGSDLRKRTRDMKTCLDRQLDPKWRPGYQDIGSPNVDINDDGDTSTSDDSETSCAIDGIGWIVCPVMSFLAELNDRAFGVLTNFLQIEDELTTNSSLRAAWSTFRDMANVAFAIAFLIIIYSQITGAGITNYGVKRLLPKMIIAAVLVNASLILCQIAVDLSNIVGSQIYNLLTNLANADSSDTNAAGGWTEVVGLLLTGAVGVGLLIAIILAPTALLAVGAAVLILIARKAIIILLIVVAPLAFVAYLLPNTEDWFKRWWKMFSTMLMLFPVIGLIFGASSLAAGIINNVAGDADGQHLLQLTALGIMAVPLFAVPLVLKTALNAAGSIGQKLSGLQDRANRRGMRSLKESRLGEAKAAFDARRQRNKVSARLGQGRMTRAGKFLERRGIAGGAALQKYDVAQVGASFDKTRAGRLVGGDRGAAAATSAYFKAVGEEVDRQGALISELGAEDLLKIGMSSKETDEKRAAAFKRLVSVGGHQHIQKAYDYLDKANAAGENVGDIQQLAADDLLKRKPAGVKTSAANALRTGTLGKVPGSGDGYYNMLRRRVQAGEFGASDYAHMDKDDIIRLGELAQQQDASGNYLLTDDDLNAMGAAFADIETDETLKGTMNDERRALFGSIRARSGPMQADGVTPRQRPGTSSGGLIQL